MLHPRREWGLGFLLSTTAEVPKRSLIGQRRSQAPFCPSQTRSRLQGKAALEDYPWSQASARPILLVRAGPGGPESDAELSEAAVMLAATQAE